MVKGGGRQWVLVMGIIGVMGLRSDGGRDRW